ncbi:hypothetical protein [Cerasicoccus frondis]|uniref:hypothetical protein n=1 Tax=Cerasicoccus frondis TaxID=490090 RepID=UPI0028529910|nr:hypothetical protein [Cerasicoccus frondis]
MEKLAMLLQAKKADPNLAHDVVTEASDWLKGQFNTADIPFNFANCEKEYCGFSTFQIQASYHGASVTLFIKIAEIKGQAHIFADIRVLDEVQRIMFPFFGEISSDDGKLTALNYIADFLLSVE